MKKNLTDPKPLYLIYLNFFSKMTPFFFPPPTVSYFLKQAAGIEKGAGKTGHEIAGMVTARAVYEIALAKSQDASITLRDTSMLNVVKSIIGSSFKLHSSYIRMISERSCDTEDWSNDAENSALHHRNKLHLLKT
uniref:Large ribosomal subunit protein uL11 C-terminal domain-containing protein n=1 Tax=Sinocyclocheilus grahami TaxID=75366 RepID=A0A672Q6P3_SINGR